jgi:hypothetical protein
MHNFCISDQQLEPAIAYEEWTFCLLLPAEKYYNCIQSLHQCSFVDLVHLCLKKQLSDYILASLHISFFFMLLLAGFTDTSDTKTVYCCTLYLLFLLLLTTTTTTIIIIIILVVVGAEEDNGG